MALQSSRKSGANAPGGADYDKASVLKTQSKYPRTLSIVAKRAKYYRGRT
jgi:hypothetical protein